MNNQVSLIRIINLALGLLLSISSFSQSQTFTTSGTFTVPAGVTEITVEAWGGGGAGGGTTSNTTYGGGGGAGGAYARSVLTGLVPGTVYTVTVGGTKNGSTSAGGTGNPSWFDTVSTVYAQGGAGGAAPNNTTVSGGVGSAALSIGDVTYKGGNGANGTTALSGGGGGGAGSTGIGSNASTTTGGIGTTTGGGNGANGRTSENNGSNGSAFGGGGSGAYVPDNSDHAGGNGAAGKVIVNWLAPEIDVTGLSNSIIGDGTNTPTLSNNTHFGTTQIVSETVTKTFVINNTGTGDLTLGTISLNGPSEFTIDSSPTSGTIIAAGGTANIVISFSTSTIGIQTDILTIASNDANEASYQINLKAEGSKVFYDSDGDGIYDNVDIDDDNDGITDSAEENACRLSNGSSQADYKFLNETFGTGIVRGSGISSLYTVSTTYCLEDGSPGSSCSGSDPGVGDGEYTVASFITDGNKADSTGPTGPDIADWAWYAWAPIEDHTIGDTEGRMAVFNADVDPGIFYETQITGTLANVPVTYSFWVINIDEPDQNFINEEKSGNASAYTHRNLPNVTVNFLTLDRSTVIASFDTGDITRCSGDVFVPGDHTGTYPHAADATYNTCETSEWKQFTQQLTTSETAFIVQFINNAPGGAGNDLAIDDIEIRQTLCDMDNDGVADVFDLDSDDDGIPDVVEANTTAASLSEGRGTLTGVSPWKDSLGGVANGMHDDTEGISPIDTDGDGIPDYLDLDSDNDGIFDVDESGAINTNNTTFQNGDGDISGDGVGDGPESETFREKDSDGDGTIEGYGDGILDIYDFHEGNTSYADSYGNNSQGTAPLYTLDSDGDGIPNYRDPYNNSTTTYDIDTVEIYAGLPHTNGILDDTTDADGDGIMASRDGDDTVFGSPRNLDSSYSLYFDGRNDYVEDGNIIPSGDATLMAFVKTDGSNTTGNNQIVAGQDDLYIIVNDATNIVSAVVEGTTISSTTALTDGIWAHVAVTTTSGSTILYINGIAEASDTSGGITDASNFMIGRATTSNNYFKGEIDEVRVFNAALTAEKLKRIVYQELDDTNSFNSGKIIPIDICNCIGSNLVKYYKMDGYKDDILDNKKTGAIDVTGAKMYNFKDIYFQRAPLPYETKGDGDWTNSANWLYGTEWDIMSKQDNPDGASIVHIKNNINLNGSYNTQGMVGLIVDSGKEFSIESDKGLYNSFYLKLNGFIDLDGESQLVQTEGSIFDLASTGTLERDQQGNSNTYLYNYWSSPVAPTSNSSYKLPNVITNVGFLTSGYNGTTSPVKNADYWIWKYANKIGDTYSEWQHVRSTGSLLPGEGFTMKGPGTVTPDQNYILLGQPNNGNINLTINAGNDYLVGNPYASAMDANEFILDNIAVADGGRNASGNVINGALYFWDHFAVNSHYLADYQGGYATYTLMGAAVAISTDTRINATGAIGTKLPERYIPVAQGFFVSAILDANLVGESNDPGITQPVVGGTIQFKNSQRLFKKETVSGTNSGSVFLKSNSKDKLAKVADLDSDTRQKIRFMFDSPDGYHRQLLAGVDENASNNFDIGYDALLNETNKEDMFWMSNNSKFIIQAVNNFNTQQILPLGIKINKAGLATIRIDELENLDENKTILIHDKELNAYHNLKENNYQIYLDAGEYLDRFEIAFSNSAKASLDTDEIENTSLQVYFSNEKESIIVQNPDSKNIASAEMFNILGQSIYKFESITNENYLEYKTKHINPGAYIIKLKTDYGMISKKVLIK